VQTFVDVLDSKITAPKAI